MQYIPAWPLQVTVKVSLHSIFNYYVNKLILLLQACSKSHGTICLIRVLLSSGKMYVLNW
jgi:hypothetical protein